MNAMAVRLPQWQFVDPFDGLLDLAVKRLRAPARRQTLSPTTRCA